MGYATLYGDMAGGFAVPQDVPKTLVYRLCRWRNAGSHNGRPLIPQAVLDKPPSAELRPDQTDQDTLPPYDDLDPIIKAYVEDDYSYADMVAMGHNPEWVRQVITYVGPATSTSVGRRRRASRSRRGAFGKDRRLPIVNRYRPAS